VRKARKNVRNRKSVIRRRRPRRPRP
jgi:hypothetical protein